MGADRIQFHLAADAANIIEDLAGVQHSQWPTSLQLDKARWTRAALRALHAFCVDDAGLEWVVKRPGKQSSKPFIVHEPTKTSSIKFDVQLSDPDRTRLADLIRAEVANSETSALRAALGFLRGIGKELARGGTLAARHADGGTTTVDLLSIVEAERLEPTAHRFNIPLQGMSNTLATPLPEPKFSRYDRAREDRLLSIVWFCTSLNRYLACKIAALNARVRNEEKLSSDAIAEQERDYDLTALLDQFCKEEKETLAAELKRHRLLTKPFRDRVKFEACMETGERAVRTFLAARARRLNTWPGSPDTIARWRDWTHSWDVIQNGHVYRECAAPIDWIAVLRQCLATEAGSEAMVAHELQTWFIDVHDIRNAEQLGRLPGTCARLAEAFYGDSAALTGRLLSGSERRLSLPQLLHALDGSHPSRSDDRNDFESDDRTVSPNVSNWSRFCFLIVMSARFVQAVYRWKKSTEPTFDQVQLRFRSLARAELAELRARIFGGQTAIDGLHWIMRGGLVPRANAGRAWLVFGKPGCGKSTLGVHLAADMARRGRVAIIACSEERAEVVEERLSMFGLLDPERYDVVTREELEIRMRDGGLPSAALSGGSEKEKGLLVVVAASREHPKLELARLLTNVSKRAHELRQLFGKKIAAPPDGHDVEHLRLLQRRWRWMSLVVDSLDSLEVEAPSSAPSSPTSERSAMVELLRVIELSRFWGIFICGANNPLKEPLTYLADTVVELGTDPTQMHRTIQIHKCRTQPYDPGAHVLQLVEGSGVVLHPNLASIQRAVRKRARPPLDREHILPTPQCIHWPHDRHEPQGLKSGGGATRTPERLALRRALAIRRRSLVLLYGPPQSGKVPFLLNLISQRLQLLESPDWRLGANGATLIVSFRGSEQAFLRPLREAEKLGEQWHENVSDVQLLSYRADETMRAAQITHELVRRIQRSRRQGLPIESIAFVGVEALHTNLPQVAEEESFWPTVFALTGTEGITTIFSVIDPDGASGFVSQYSREMDYVLRFGRDGSERTVDTEKSPDPPAAQGYPTLRFDPQLGAVRAAYGGSSRPSAAQR